MRPANDKKLIILIRDRLHFLLRVCLSYTACLFRFGSPSIVSFTHDTYLAIDGAWITFRWEVRNAWKVNITGGGTFIRETSCRVPVNVQQNTFSIVACGIIRNARKTIRLNTVMINKPVRFNVSMKALPPAYCAVPVIRPANLYAEICVPVISIRLDAPARHGLSSVNNHPSATSMK